MDKHKNATAPDTAALIGDFRKVLKNYAMTAIQGHDVQFWALYLVLDCQSVEVCERIIREFPIEIRDEFRRYVEHVAITPPEELPDFVLGQRMCRTPAEKRPWHEAGKRFHMAFHTMGT